MELILVAVGLACLWLIVKSHKPRVSPWRNPRSNSSEEVQAEHLRLFESPRGDGEDSS